MNSGKYEEDAKLLKIMVEQGDVGSVTSLGYAYEKE